MVRCCYCGGRGWVWRGIASNAERELCEPCGGSGHTRTLWGAIGGLLLVLLSAAWVIWIIVWTTQAAFGESAGSAGSVTLNQFRLYPDHIRIALLAGAMAATEHASLVCPAPQMTVAEYAATLQWRVFDEEKPWIVYYFQLIDERGCRVPEEEIDGKEGA